MHASLEEQLVEHCPSCGEEHHAKFFSLFLGEMHYVIGDCSVCGYHIEFRKDDLGGGLFLPDGSVSTVKETFKHSSVEHMKERVKDASGERPLVLNTFSRMRLRLVDEQKK